MKKIIHSFLFTFGISLLSAQTYQVLDEDSRPLSFVNVYYPQSKTGAYTNEEGQFLIPNGYQDADSIIISHLGYDDMRTTIFAIRKNLTHIFILSPKSYSINDVVVKPLDAKDMIRAAIRQLNENYPTDYSSTEFIFKDYSKRSGERSHYYYFDYVGYIKSYADSNIHLNTVKKWEMYKAKNQMTPTMNPDELTQLMFLKKIFSEKELSEHEFKFAGSTTFGGKEMDVISFKNIPQKKSEFASVKGKVYLQQDNKAIRYVDFKIRNEKAKRFFLVAKMDSLDVLVQLAFKPLQNKYVIDYISQKTFAKGTLFGKKENLEYSTTCKAISHQLNVDAASVPKNSAIKEIMKNNKPKDMKELQSEPNMQ